MPPALPDVVLTLRAGGEENRLLRLLQMKYRKNRLALFLRILQMESDPRMLLTRLDLKDFRYLLDDSAPVEEIDFADYSVEVRQMIENCQPSGKFLRCVELLEERQEILRDFKAGRFQVLLTNPHTLAESVSLHSVCHNAIYFEYSYNLVHLLQSKDRIHRLGLPEGQYTQYIYLQTEYETEDGTWSMDDAVYRRLLEKEQTMLEAIDRRVLEVLPTSEEDLEMIFGPLFRREKREKKV